MHPEDDPQAIHLQRLLLQSLASWADAGVRQTPQKGAVEIDLPSAAEASSQSAAPESAMAQPSRCPSKLPARPVSRPASTAPSSLPPSDELVTANMINEPMPPRVADPAAELQVLQQEVSGCTLCGELASTRTQTVFGMGDPKARLAFFGEAPGADEDRRGEPFVGRAGQLLTKIIEACTLTRDDVYILNTLKCRPPGNRNPTDKEAHNCRPYFEKQLELIQPEYLCCLGLVASKHVLQTNLSLGKLRGTFHDYRGIKVVATYHPAYLLRNPPAKRQVWEDMQMLMKDMGIELPNTK